MTHIFYFFKKYYPYVFFVPFVLVIIYSGLFFISSSISHYITPTPTITPKPTTAPIATPTIYVPSKIDEYNNYYNFLLEKQIGEHTYFFTSDPTVFLSVDYGVMVNGNQLPLDTLFDSTSSEFLLLDYASRFINPTTNDFWIDFPSGTIFLVQSLADDNYYGGQGETGVFSINTIISDSVVTGEWNLLTVKKAPLYSAIGIDTYLSDSQTLLMKTMGGDGCAGWGSIWKLGLDGVVTEISEIGTGCSLNPRYYGLKDNTIILVQESYDSEKYLTQIVSIWGLDLNTLERTTYTDLFEYEGYSIYAPDWLFGDTEFNLLPNEILVRQNTDFLTGSFWGYDLTTHELRLLSTAPQTPE